MGLGAMPRVSPAGPGEAVDQGLSLDRVRPSLARPCGCGNCDCARRKPFPRAIPFQLEDTLMGSQIGGIIGQVVGAYFGGPAGAAIGQQLGSWLGGAIAGESSSGGSGSGGFNFSSLFNQNQSSGFNFGFTGG